jgi:autotransporter-associated beta strand protein
MKNKLFATFVAAARQSAELLNARFGGAQSRRSSAALPVFLQTEINGTNDMKTKRSFLQTALLCLVGLGLQLPAVPKASAAGFVNTGPLSSGRYVHTTTLLPNGKVLVAGGNTNGTVLSSAELYDPAAGTWTATGAMSTNRYIHTATLLPNGKVLIAGGYHNSPLSSAELYDPATGTWTATGAMNTERYGHTATLLPNGMVLVAGGVSGAPYLSSAELYDPATETWTATGAMSTERYGHTATLLPNGKVLVTGGYNGSVYLSSAELYDPAMETWTATSAMSPRRYFHTETLLPNGKVLVAGGITNNSTVLSSAELYDPATGTWTATGAMSTRRYVHTATLLLNGKVLVTGGLTNFNNPTVSSAELYDPATGTFTATGAMSAARYYHTATLLPNGKVLVAGGRLGGTYLSSAELYADAATRTWDGGGTNDNWTTAGNWVGDVAPTAGDDLVFPPGAARLINVNNFAAGTAFNSIAFTDSGYRLTGSNVLLTAGIIASHSSGVNEVWLPIQLNANQSFTNTGAGELYLLFQTIDLNGRELTFGVGGGGIAVSSAVVGTGSVLKIGPGRLDLVSSNSYTGTTEVQAGTLRIGADSALGTTNNGTSISAGASLLLDPAFPSLTVNEPLTLAGTLQSTGPGGNSNVWAGPITLSAASAKVFLTGQALVINGVISGGGALTIVGLPGLTLNATNTYTGGTTNIGFGTVVFVNGSQPQSPFTMNSGTLGGTGTVGTITCTGFFAKTLAPGASPGILNSSNVTFDDFTTFPVELNGTMPGGGYDQLNVNGTVSLGSCLLSNSLGYAPAVGDSFTIISNDGADPVSGTFNGLPAGALLTNGATIFRIAYNGGDGNDVILTTTLGAPASTLTSITNLPGSFKQLTGQGVSNLTYTVQAATNLAAPITWTLLGAATANSSGVYQFTDTNAPLFPLRFYRAVSP